MYVYGTILVFSSLVNLVFSDCKPTSTFDKHYNEALQGHVIKTIQINRFDCTMECSEIMGCRSINIYKDGSGKNMCDLNKSSKSKSPGSMVIKADCEHWELTVSHRNVGRENKSTSRSETCSGSNNRFVTT